MGRIPTVTRWDSSRERHWLCTSHIHMGTLTYPAAAKRCAYGTCPGVRPISEGSICSWEKCGLLAQENSIYCSRNCSNKNARKRHRLRKRKQITA